MPWILIALIVLSIPLVIGLYRINELFVLRIRAGRLRVVRGRIPAKLLRDLEDVVHLSGVRDAKLRAVIEDGRAVVRVEGDAPAGLHQRLRNTISLWPLAKIRNAPKR